MGNIVGTMNAAYYISSTVPLLLYHNTRNARRTTCTLNQEPTSMENLVALDADDGERECSNYSQNVYRRKIGYLPSFSQQPSMASWYWVSAIIRSLWLWCYDKQIQNPVSTLSVRSGLFEFGLRLSRLTTCLDAAASLHQFPKLLYKLRQSNQPRPILFLPTILKQLINAYMYILPMCFAADIAQLRNILRNIE